MKQYCTFFRRGPRLPDCCRVEKLIGYGTVQISELYVQTPRLYPLEYRHFISRLRNNDTDLLALVLVTSKTKNSNAIDHVLT